MVNFNALITLQGAANTGKTASISRAFLRTLEKKPLIRYFKYYEKGDFIAIVEFKDQYMSFCSAGDDLELVNKFELLNKEALEQGVKCFDVFIVAYRTRGKTCEIIKQYLEQNTQARVKEFKSLTKSEFYEENGKFLQTKMEKYAEQCSEELYKTIKSFL
ncbi:hypothetical protein L8W40_04560 [Campylobacter sp. IFREMER_LSEM_CL1846]|uniref:hypothetical protein n=1 Tax=Campylobacter sp. IFREMER_LSEM_CL1846 TaxID=2911614 RepID=UPI0021E668A8|nr:hypothetical protein [Campylobacter sp. IFREMER_LSEM_CL1846]HEC1747678.1 hypothetical protein [Campylobacter lari]MCV3434327.1 hypothetical protein [Campylobacter sp. IFREMER_LSEM_CL1846]HEC1768181.1 hypothetical protein [Campylobacter lari]HEC1789831.1 hypothetical protein [Campylobacter lari]HEC1795962.1 hypothetical protein [Campylobacter lari]